MERRKKKKKNAKFSGHYVRPCMHNMRAHALRLHQFPFHTDLVYARDSQLQLLGRSKGL